jgi:hypothetical protein
MKACDQTKKALEKIKGKELGIQPQKGRMSQRKVPKRQLAAACGRLYCIFLV